MAAPVLLSHASSLEHDTGVHPERAQRIVAIERALADRPDLAVDRRSSPAAPREALEAVHPGEYLEQIERLCAVAAAVDLDTVTSPGSWEAALHAAGGAVELVDVLADGEAQCGFSVHRPPGHHAEQARAMGFCLLNNVAVAARHALDDHGMERVLILDWDVHHGNGTNDIFHASAEVLYVSIHQSPLYPGTGQASDRGSGSGLGATINLPVRPGSGDREFVALLHEVVLPAAREHRPQIVLVSAGYDAHADDPLAGCEVSDDGYAEMTRLVRELAGELGVGLGLVLEGGYDVDALARSVVRSVEALV